jgi:hypothetical protein
MRAFFFGPDDRYPRGLYWTTLLVLAFDTALYAFFFVDLLRHPRAGGDWYLHTRNVLGHFCAVICPLIMLILVAAGFPEGLIVFSLTKMFLLLAVVGNFLGMGLIGERPDGRVYGALATWNLLALVTALVYWKVRNR